MVTALVPWIFLVSLWRAPPPQGSINSSRLLEINYPFLNADEIGRH